MCQLLRAKSVATKESLLQSILEEFHYICKVHVENVCVRITYAKYMWKMCVRIAMRYLCTIHITDAYSSTTTRKMQVHQCI